MKRACPFVVAFVGCLWPADVRLGSAQIPTGISTEGPVTSVQRVANVPSFTVDTLPFATPCFETYAPQPRYFDQFAAAGTKLFSFNTNAASCDYGHSAPTWTDPDTFDYVQLDERMHAVLRARPDALVIPRVYVGTPAWWLQANPEELEVLDDGSTLYTEPNRNPTLPKHRPFPSIVSEKWRSDMVRGLRELVEHIQGSDSGRHIFGYLITGLDTEEWYHWSSGSDQLAGYSKPTQRAFRAWLRRRYGTVDALRKAWSRADVDFETAQVPSREERYDFGKGTFRDPSGKRNVIDFYLFYNDIIPETADYFAGVVKQMTGGRKVVGAFYGYMYEFGGDPEFGHNALQRYNHSRNLDFILVTASYENRQFATGGDYLRSPALSVRLHDRLWYHDNDTISFLAPQVMKRVGMPADQVTRHLQVLGVTGTAEETRWMYRRSAGFSICNGLYMSFFDLHGGYFDHRDLMEEVRKLNRLFEAAIRRDLGSCSEILVVSDEASCAFVTFRSNLLPVALQRPQPQLIKIGAPADHVLLDDLVLLNTDPYKLVIFLNAYNLNDRQRSLVKEKIKGRRRHVLWCYAPGYLNETRASPDLMQELTGMGVVPSASEDYVAPLIRLAPDNQAFKADACTVGFDQECAKLFYVNDPTARALGHDPAGSKVTLAVKETGDWTSYYSITPVLPAVMYRQLARRAGVHIFNDRDDTFYANRSYVTVHANGAGPRTLRFPRPCDVYDAIDEALVAENRDAYACNLRNGETRILRWEIRPRKAE